MDNRWGHVSLSFWWHRVQLGFCNLSGQKIFFSVVAHVLGILDFKVLGNLGIRYLLFCQNDWRVSLGECTLH